MSGERRNSRRGYYRQIYGISPWSVRYWWGRLRGNRGLFRGFVAALFLLVGVVVLALTVFKPVVAGWYHGLRSDQYNARARAHLDKGDAASAKIELQNSLRHDPGKGSTLGLYAKTLDALGEESAFLAAVEAWLAAPSNAELGAQALRLSMRSGQGEAAAFVAPRLVKEFPGNASIRLLMASFWLMQGRPDFAYQAARKARELDPKSPEAEFAAASLGALQSDPKVREPSIARLEAYRGDAKRFLPATRALVTALAPKDPAAALRLIDEAIARAENPWPERMQRIAIARRLKPDGTPAELDALLAVAASPAQTNAVASLSLRLCSAEQTQRLLDRLDAAGRGRPPLLMIQLQLWAKAKAWAQVSEKSSAALREELTQAQKLALWMWQAKAQSELRDRTAVQTSIRAAMGLCRDEPLLKLHAAQSFLAFGFNEEARTCFAELAETHGRLGVFARERLLALGKMSGSAGDMLAAAEKAFEANPKNPVAMNNVAACLLMLERDPVRALALANAAHAARPKFPHFADTFASALVANGRVPEAVAIYEKTDFTRVKDPSVWLNRAHAFFLAGRVPEARAMLTNVNEKALLPQQSERLLVIRGSEPGAAAAPPAPETPPPAPPMPQDIGLMEEAPAKNP